MENEQVDAIKETFKSRAVIHSNIWMYFIKNAIDIIQYCRKNNINIQGFDAFKLSGYGIQPSMNNSIRFDRNRGNWDEATDFISKTENAEFLYEIWYDGY